jgi:hypothetical protein
MELSGTKIAYDLDLYPDNAVDELEKVGFLWESSWGEFLKTQYDEEGMVEKYEVVNIEYINRRKDKTFHWVRSTDMYSRSKHTDAERTFYSFNDLIAFLKQNSFNKK